MINIEQYQTTIDECDIHANRLGNAYTHLLSIFPLTEESFSNLEEMQISLIDQLIFRFSKLQDAIGSKVFPLLVEALQNKGTEGMTFIDILNRLEKADLLPSMYKWKDMRDFRNHLTHEYPDKPDIMIKNLNASLEHIKNLLDYWKSLRPRAIEIMKKASL